MTTSGPARSSLPLALFRLILFLVVCAILFVGFLLARLPVRDVRAVDRVRSRWIHRWGRWVMAAWGIHLTSEGEPADGCLLAPNHIGYGDILAMAAVTPCFFVTKTEVINAPVAGTILRAVGIPHVERRVSQQITGTADRLGELFSGGHRVCVFLEGTSTGGDRVLPFRPAMCHAALQAGAAIQPVGVTWSSETPGVDIAEDIAYWRDEHTIGRHSLRFLGLRGTRVHVRFGEPLTGCTDRKEAARVARERVLALAGLPDSPGAPVPE